MPACLMERYGPRVAGAQLAEIAGTATAAAGQTGDSPAAVRYLAVTPVPSNEPGYCLFEAPPSMQSSRRMNSPGFPAPGRAA